jgi:putative tryptophan/tyrosine transport system substrate-binding protein
VRRREFIALAGAVATAFPFAARAEETRSLRRVGILNPLAKTDVVAREWDAALRQRFAELGWVDGRNVRLEERWGDGNVDRIRTLAKELVHANPDVLVAIMTPATAALRAETRTIPIVFVAVSDPVGSGFVASLAKPGGNATGFIDVEGAMGGKWLELLHEIAPSVSRVAFLFNPQTAPFARYYLEPFQAAASALSIQPIEAPVHDAAEVEALITRLGREGTAGVIVMPETSSGGYFGTVRSFAERYRLPTMFALGIHAETGGLASYGVDYPELLRKAANYTDRILKGTRPTELPVQIPTKFEFIINLKTAKAIGLTVPASLLARADQVIE